jgi:hypothetical protein
LTKVIIQADNLAALGASCNQVVAVVGLAAERVARDLRDRRVLKRAGGCPRALTGSPR